MVGNSLIIEINQYLEYIEDYFSLAPFGLQEQSEDIWFIRGNRYPIVKRYKYDVDAGDFGIRRDPYYPWKSATCFARLVKYSLYRDSEYIMIHHNKSIVSNSPKELFGDYCKDMTDIILEYIPNLTLDARDAIINVVNDFVNNHEVLLASLRHHIIEYDVDGEYLKIKDYGDILAYRYKEGMHAKGLL